MKQTSDILDWDRILVCCDPTRPGICLYDFKGERTLIIEESNIPDVLEKIQALESNNFYRTQSVNLDEGILLLERVW